MLRRSTFHAPVDSSIAIASIVALAQVKIEAGVLPLELGIAAGERFGHWCFEAIFFLLAWVIDKRGFF